jgi:endonuclease/exonuclease/phosphatase family metal-dependent hydrolase
MKKIFLSIFSILLALNSIPSYASVTLKHRIEENVLDTKPDNLSGLTFNDLVKLSKQAKPSAELNKKLQAHLSMTYVVNRKYDAKLDKSYIRFANWNIHRGRNIEVIKDILLKPGDYERKYLSKVNKRNQKNFKAELDTFVGSDVIALNEVDIGMPRTEYKNIVANLADSLGWNYAYSTEFVEVGPIYQNLKIDRNRYRGLHGNAIISKYPIVSSRVVRLPNQYDWYGGETKKYKSPVEYVRYGISKVIFSQEIEYKEVRHGSRNVLIADLKLPNNKIVTVVSTHLEDRAYPDQRLKQFKALLNSLKDIKTPIVLCGDFNTSTTDTKPTSVQKEVIKRIRDPHFIARTTAIAFIPGLPYVYGISAVTLSKLLQYKDPFFPSIPAFFPNHERRFYAYLKKFQFDDGNKFDLSGDKKRSSNRRKGLLANSNQRHWKGFKSTFKFEKPRIIAYFKLDWFFIKPVNNQFLPFNGRTLKTFNSSFPHGLSDHNPITVDLKL